MRCPPFGISWTPTGEAAGLIHFNPCGHPVDWGRRPYTTTARFFRDSDVEVPIKWYPADPDKKPLPFPSRICSLDWVTEPHRAQPPGEVWGEDRPFSNAKNPGPIHGNHFCGTEDEFRNGEQFNPLRPLMEYWPSGIPKCCDPGRREVVGISVPHGHTRTIRSDPYRPMGNVTLRSVTYTVRSDPHRTSGGASVTTHCHTVRSDPYYTSGGPKLKGRTFAETVGVCGEPGNTCEEAGVTGLNVWCVFTAGDLTLYWRKYRVVIGAEYTFEIQYDNETGHQWSLYQGPSCGLKEVIEEGDDHLPFGYRAISFVATSEWVYWFPHSASFLSPVGQTRLRRVG